MRGEIRETAGKWIISIGGFNTDDLWCLALENNLHRRIKNPNQRRPQYFFATVIFLYCYSTYCRIHSQKRCLRYKESGSSRKKANRCRTQTLQSASKGQAFSGIKFSNDTIQSRRHPPDMQRDNRARSARTGTSHSKAVPIGHLFPCGPDRHVLQVHFLVPSLSLLLVLVPS